MKGSVKLPVFIDDARKLVNTTQLRAKYLGASYEAEYCQWQTLHGLGSLMKTASLIITPNAYLEGKLLASYPPDPIGDFDVTRATTATRVNSQGLVELVPYNLLQYSEQFNNGIWTAQNVSLTTNATTAPDGTTTAEKIIINSGSQADPIVYQLLDTNASTRTLSFFAKASEYNIAFGRIGGAVNAPIVLFSLTGSGSILHNQNVSSYSIQALTNGWYRCSMTYAHGSSFAPNIGVCSATYSVGTSTVTSTGNGTSGIFIWGAQVVEGSVAKDYQKTETRLNIPRLDYSNGTCPSILVEPQRTNLLTYSSSFDNGSWSAIDTTITANTTASPNGNTDADTMAITSSTSRIFKYTALGSGTYTASIYVKSLSGTPTIQFRMVVDGSDITQSIPTTTDWVRHDFTFTASSSMDYFVIRGESGTGSVAIYGAQLEVGSYATSYIPTTSASVTRNADVISKTGISSLIGQTEGTMFWEFKNPIATGTNDYINLSDGTPNNWIFIGINGSSFICYINTGGVNQVYLTSPLSVGTHKIAIGYKNNDVVFYVDGAQVGSDASASIPTTSRLDLSVANMGGAKDTANYTKAAALWKTRLTNTQLAQLTTI